MTTFDITILLKAIDTKYYKLLDNQNRETANIGLVSSVGRAPARQSGGRSFKSCSSKFYFVYPKLLDNY